MRFLFVFVFLSSVAFGQNDVVFYDLYQIDELVKQIDGKSYKESKLKFGKHFNNLDLRVGERISFNNRFKRELINHPVLLKRLKKIKLKKTLGILSTYIYPITSGIIIGSSFGFYTILYIFSGEGAAVYFGGSIVCGIPGMIIYNKAENEFIDLIKDYHKEYKQKLNE